MWVLIWLIFKNRAHTYQVLYTHRTHSKFRTQRVCFPSSITKFGALTSYQLFSTLVLHTNIACPWLPNSWLTTETKPNPRTSRSMKQLEKKTFFWKVFYTHIQEIATCRGLPPSSHAEETDSVDNFSCMLHSGQYFVFLKSFFI